MGVIVWLGDFVGYHIYICREWMWRYVIYAATYAEITALDK